MINKASFDKAPLAPNPLLTFFYAPKRLWAPFTRREEKSRAVGRDWKGKQENDEGCFNRERRMQSAGKYV